MSTFFERIKEIALGPEVASRDARIMSARNDLEKTLFLYDVFLDDLAAYYVSYFGQVAFDAAVSQELISRNADGSVDAREGRLHTSGLRERIMSAAKLTGEGESPGWEGSYKLLFAAIYGEMSKKLGEGSTGKVFNRLFKKYQARYGVTLTERFLAVLPEQVLELSEWAALFSKEELERRITEKTKKLRELNDTLEKSVEERTRELRQTVSRLKEVVEQQEKATRMLIKRDMELVRANEMLRELDIRKTEFLAIVAHQLRTPLSGIKWTLDMLMGGDLGELTTEQKSFLQKSYDNNQRMIALVEDMLNADRIGSGKARFVFGNVILVDVLDSVLYNERSRAKDKGITVVYNPATDSKATVYGDKDRLADAFQNLIDNAIKYTPKGGTVTISLQKKDGALILSVTDTGIGIPEHEKKNVYNRFFRAPNALSAVADGSGLGLFIVKGIVEKHGGSTWFESKEGVGSTFYISLPTV